MPLSITQNVSKPKAQPFLNFLTKAFGRISMLYINVTVHGVPVKAFVDSGAEATISMV